MDRLCKAYATTTMGPIGKEHARAERFFPKLTQGASP